MHGAVGRGQELPLGDGALESIEWINLGHALNGVRADQLLAVEECLVSPRQHLGWHSLPRHQPRHPHAVRAGVELVTLRAKGHAAAVVQGVALDQHRQQLPRALH